MTKPTQDPKWVISDDPENMVEPSYGAKLNGVLKGGIWAREHLNWMFNANSKWIDWIRDHVRSNTENDARYVQLGSQVGDVKFTAGSVAPTGWIKADGSAISRTTYADLFSVVGTIYGTGNGTTTFNLPDLRGEFIRGWDDSRGADSGRTLGSFQDSDNKSHSHSATSSKTGDHRHSIPSRGNDSTGNGYVEDASSGGTVRTTYTGDEGSHTHIITVGSSGGTESRPRNVAMLAVIKY
jgi:microcystin-dependent protein